MDLPPVVVVLIGGNVGAGPRFQNSTSTFYIAQISNEHTSKNLT